MQECAQRLFQLYRMEGLAREGGEREAFFWIIATKQ